MGVSSTWGLPDDGQLGDFTLLRVIGRGGQGEVYEARQTSLGRLVALKLLAPATAAPEHVRWLRREAEVAARLVHPNIVTVHALGEAQGVHFIVQELVPGGRTLADVLDEARRLPELPADWYRRTAECFARVADALHAAHEAGFIHFDVKPSNILITPDGQPKVADFGLARLLGAEAEASRSGALVGTPFSMSPEQAAGSRTGTDRRTDVFSLGTTLYEALTLTRPFQGDTRSEILERILFDEPVEPRRVRPRVPRDLAVICLHALEKRRERRYATAAAMAADLRHWLADEPIVARPPGPLVRAGKWSRRHPVISVAGSVAGVALVVVSLLLVHAERQSEQLAFEYARVEHANEQTRQERSQAEAMLDALIEDLRQLDPLKSGTNDEHGAELSVRMEQMADELQASPARQASVLQTVAFNYRNATNYPKARELFARVLSLHTQLEGPEAPETLRAALDLGSIDRLMGDTEAALARLRSVFEACERLQSPDDELHIDAAVELGLLYKDMGELGSAEQLLRKQLEEAGGDDLALLPLRHALGVTLREQGRLDEAEPLLVNVVTVSEHQGTPAMVVAIFREGLAELRTQQSSLARAEGDADLARKLANESEALYLAALKAQLATRGERNENTAATRTNLGTLYRQLGRLEEARIQLDTAYGTLTELFGAGDWRSLNARNGLGVVDYFAGHTETAEQTWRSVIEACRALPAHQAQSLLTAQQNLVTLLAQQGRREEALPLARDLVDRTPETDSRRTERLQLLAQLTSSPADQVGN